jgi:hypothetical protein
MSKVSWHTSVVETDRKRKCADGRCKETTTQTCNYCHNYMCQNHTDKMKTDACDDCGLKLFQGSYVPKNFGAVLK